MLRQSKPVKLELVPTEKEFAELQSFKYHAEPGQYVYVHIDSGLKSFGAICSAGRTSASSRCRTIPKLLRFMADGSLLSLSGDKRVSVVSRNVTGMKVEIGRVLPDQLQHLVSFNDGTYAKPDLSYKMVEDHIVERFTDARVFPRAIRDRRITRASISAST